MKCLANHVKVDISTLKGVLKIKKFDLAIIGAGPIGLFAANYAQLHGLKTVIFDSLNEVGGQPQMLYPFKTINDIPVYQAITATNLITQLKKGLNKDTSIVTNHSVTQIEKRNEEILIDDKYSTRSLIIATGNGAFDPKKLPLKLDSEIEKRIHYYVRNPKEFSGKTVAIFGGGDSALDWALELSHFSNIVLVHRRPQFRGLESTLSKLRQLKNVKIITPYLPKQIQIEDNQLSVTLKRMGNTYLQKICCDRIVVAYGFKANNRLIRKWGIKLTDARIAVNSSMQTNLPGIYAVGDAISYPGRVPVIGVGFGEVQIAINAIMRDLFPEKTLTIHSTSM